MLGGLDAPCLAQYPIVQPQLGIVIDDASLQIRGPTETRGFSSACWQPRGGRSGFEVAYFTARQHSWRIDGTTAAIEDAQTWVVTYRIEVDAAWATRSARITARTATEPRETRNQAAWRLSVAAPGSMTAAMPAVSL
jgi:hypothetical protein